MPTHIPLEINPIQVQQVVERSITVHLQHIRTKMSDKDGTADNTNSSSSQSQTELPSTPNHEKSKPDNNCKKCGKKGGKGIKGGGLIKCSVCEKPFHYKCLDLDDKAKESFEYIYEKTGCRTPYTCPYCDGVLKKVESRLARHDVAIEEVKESTKALEEKVASQQAELEKQSLEIIQIKKDMEELKLNSPKRNAPAAQVDTANATDAVLKEMHQREAKEFNIVIQNYQELQGQEGNDQESKRLRKEHDKKLVTSLLEYLEEEEPTEAVLNSVFRLGSKKQNGKPRPLRIKLPSREQKGNILKKAPKLKDADSEVLKKVRIEPDLTRAHIQKEFGMWQEARAKNLTRPEEMVEKGMAFKVVGKVGQRWVKAVTLTPGEEIDAEGKIQQTQGRGKRLRETDGTPESRKEQRMSIAE